MNPRMSIPRMPPMLESMYVISDPRENPCGTSFCTLCGDGIDIARRDGSYVMLRYTNSKVLRFHPACLLRVQQTTQECVEQHMSAHEIAKASKGL